MYFYIGKIQFFATVKIELAVNPFTQVPSKEMSRTLLPVFSKYSLDLNLDAKEPVENFSFLTDASTRYDYEAFRAGLDGIPGSREYLKGYTVPEGSRPFFDSMGNQIMCAAGDHHSGASGTGLGWSYKQLLNDWDGWVKAVKFSQAKRKYNNSQIERPSTWQFANSTSEEGKKKGLDALRAQFNLTYSDEEIALMVRELISEFNENSRLEMLEYEQERFNDRIEVLEHHYKHPERWDDYGEGKLNSALFGRIQGITEEMFVSMEKKYPHYRAHIRDLKTPHVPRCACGACHNKRVANGTQAEYETWVHAEAAAVLSRPPRSSVSVNPMMALLSAGAKADSAIASARNMPEGDSEMGFLKNLFQTVQGVKFDDKCPHDLPFYACMSCSH